MTRKLIQIPEDLHKRLKLRSVELGITIPEVIKAALRGESGAKTPVAVSPSNAKPVIEKTTPAEPVPETVKPVHSKEKVIEPEIPEFSKWRTEHPPADG